MTAQAQFGALLVKLVADFAILVGAFSRRRLCPWSTCVNDDCNIVFFRQRRISLGPALIQGTDRPRRLQNVDAPQVSGGIARRSYSIPENGVGQEAYPLQLTYSTSPPGRRRSPQPRLPRRERCGRQTVQSRHIGTYRCFGPLPAASLCQCVTQNAHNPGAGQLGRFPRQRLIFSGSPAGSRALTAPSNALAAPFAQEALPWDVVIVIT